MERLCYTMKDVADMMGVGIATIKKMIESGQLRTIKFNTAVRVVASDIEKLMADAAPARILEFTEGSGSYHNDVYPADEAYMAVTPFWDYMVMHDENGWHAAYMCSRTTSVSSMTFISETAYSCRADAEAACSNDFQFRIAQCKVVA